MRTLLFTLSFLVLGLACTATQVATSSPTSATTAGTKLSLDSLAWTTDLKTAEKIAQENDLRILMIFSGSDWCRPCQAFKKEVLKDQSFRDSAKDQIVVLYLDFPTKKGNQLSKEEMARNAKLAEQYNSNGIFPTILLMSPDESTTPCEMKYKGDDAGSWIKRLPKAIEKCNV